MSQDVEATRKETPDSEETTFQVPPSWIPLMKKIMRWYDNQQYPIWAPFFKQKTRSAKTRNRQNTLLKTIADLWSALGESTQDDWNTAAEFVNLNGYQLFVKDTSYRIKNGLSFPASPNTKHQTHGLVMKNPGGSEDVYIQRDDKDLIGPVTLSFNYKKVENSLTGGDPFNITVQLWYFEDGENKTENYTYNIGSGNIDWTEFSEEYGTAGRKYFHHRVEIHLENYDAEVYLANFLISGQPISWTVEYDCTTLPENADPAWSKEGSFEEIDSKYSKLFIEASEGYTNTGGYSRTPTFNNSLGSSAKWRLKIVSGADKDAGNDKWTTKVTHSDGEHKVEFLFYTNGIILKLGSEYYKYHYSTDKYRRYKSYILGDRLYFYINQNLAFRKLLTTAGGQEVKFEHQGLEEYETESRWGYVKYYDGKDEMPDEYIAKESWFIKTGEIYEPANLYRKRGWTFYPEYELPYFEVDFLEN